MGQLVLLDELELLELVRVQSPSRRLDCIGLDGHHSVV